MNHPFILLVAAVLSIGISWNALIVGPQKHFGKLSTKDGGASELNGQQKQGRLVYAESGCVKCHTQQVRFFEKDAQYGPRFSTANDFLGHDKPVLGSVRIGPDLSNLGNTKYGLEGGDHELFKVLFHAKNAPALEDAAKAALMPQYRYLFDQVKISDLDSDHPYLALAEDLGKMAKADDNIGFVPNSKGIVLVEYLLGLKLDQSIYVSPIPTPEKEEEKTEEEGSQVQESQDGEQFE